MAKSQTHVARKLTTAEKLTRSSLFWLSVLLFVALPFINNFIIQTVVLNISGNIAYEALAPALSTVAGILSVLTAYAGIGAIAASIANFGAKGSVGTIILGLNSHVIGLLSAMFAYALSGARNYEYAVFALGVDAIANVLVYALIIVVLALMSRKRLLTDNTPPQLGDKLLAKGGAYTYIVTATVLFGAAQLAATLYTMIYDFLDPSIGTPINLQEWIYWITKYLTTLIYLGIGYMIVLGIFHLCNYYRTRFAEKKSV